MPIKKYISDISKVYKSGIATEHTYRQYLATLIETLHSSVTAVNEPSRIECGAPDYIVMRKDISVGYIEAKDIDKNLNDKAYQEQFARYKASLNNLIITDYLNFELYKDGAFVLSARIAQARDGKLLPIPAAYEDFTKLLNLFISYKGQSITSSSKLAKIMADKAKMLAEVLLKAIQKPDKGDSIQKQFEVFKKILIGEISETEFADIYAQTIAYGMFAARLHDKNPDSFSLNEAHNLMPKSNPFLKKLFAYIAGYDIDERIKWIVEDLAKLFLLTDISEIVKSFNKAAGEQDIIHFYETFLSEYNPQIRKERGVWFTPAPVVNFIVRCVDDILKDDFDLKEGLADSSKIKLSEGQPQGIAPTNAKNNESNIVAANNQSLVVEIHRIQILDPAAGTGTFLAEIIKQIHKKIDKGQWSAYIGKHLLPRIHGFEVLMASYAMAHLRLDILLEESGFNFDSAAQRLGVYLTNSLDDAKSAQQDIPFAQWLTDEANSANAVKKDTPVMVVLGNPPYSGESANKGDWIMEQMEVYKREPAGGKLQEKNSKWINDDYVKFIRYAEQFIEKNNNGIIAYINNHGFLDNPTFRGMRWHLLNTFDKIYIIDLHGNAKKKEISPDGSKDENVFDIQQGVSVNIFVKNKNAGADNHLPAVAREGQTHGSAPTDTDTDMNMNANNNKSDIVGANPCVRPPLAKIYHYDLYGSRESKFNFLKNNKLKNIDFTEVKNTAPNYFFVPKDFAQQGGYDTGFAINELFIVNGVGICSKRDTIAYKDIKDELLKVLNDFNNLDERDLKDKYAIKKESRDQKIVFAKNNIKEFGIKPEYINDILYRPFDLKKTYYTNKSRGFLAYPVYQIMRHFINKENVGILLERIVGNKNTEYRDVFITNKIYDLHTLGSGCYSFPLYLYPETEEVKQGEFAQTKQSQRKANFNKEIIEQFEKELGLKFKTDDNLPAVLERQTQEGQPQGIAPTNAKNNESNIVGAGFKPALRFFAIDILDYIYAVLHSPKYRQKYKEFLKIDFPKIPYPKDIKKFWKLVKLGGKLRKIHLLESDNLETIKITYPQQGDNIVEKITTNAKNNEPNIVWADNYPPAVESQNNNPPASERKMTKNANDYPPIRIYINKTQYFDNIPQSAWDFYIGGYQPAQKYLKDRKSRRLSYDDIERYKKIINALYLTRQTMQEIDDNDLIEI